MNDQICPTQKGRNLGFFAYQRLLENMGLVEKSSVTAYLEEYYEKHPLDNSYEGVLARRSGLTKDQVIAYLDKLEYLAKIAEYDPTGKAPILKGDAREDHQFRIESKNNEEYLLGVNIFYIEERRIQKLCIIKNAQPFAAGHLVTSEE